MFCPKCGSLLRPKNDGKRGRILACSCGYESKGKVEGGKIIEEKESSKIEVMDKVEIRPLTDEECPKCGHKKAYYWSKQTRAGDEPETRFFECERCKYKWREYS